MGTRLATDEPANFFERFVSAGTRFVACSIAMVILISLQSSAAYSQVAPPSLVDRIGNLFTSTDLLDVADIEKTLDIVLKPSPVEVTDGSIVNQYTLANEAPYFSSKGNGVLNGVSYILLGAAGGTEYDIYLRIFPSKGNCVSVRELLNAVPGMVEDKSTVVLDGSLEHPVLKRALSPNDIFASGYFKGGCLFNLTLIKHAADHR